MRACGYPVVEMGQGEGEAARRNAVAASVVSPLEVVVPDPRPSRAPNSNSQYNHLFHNPAGLGRISDEQR